ncbi:MAG: hypothetical protein Q7S71_03630 [Candidatus Nitrotoga sp.]|nr:hypothetical protein [Candidatus Nitrotoga sp.]
MYALLYIFDGGLSSALVPTPNRAFENGRADKHPAFSYRQRGRLS